MNGSLEKIREAKTGAPNYGLDTEDIIGRLRQWQARCEFTVTGAERDAVDLKFETLPQDMDAFAKELYEFCPDLVDQGTGVAGEMMAEMQAEGKSLPPEWESLLAGVDLSDENCGVEILKREVQKKMAVSLWWD